MEQNSEILKINMKALWQILFKEKWLILITCIFFLIGGGIYAFSIKEEFKAEGKILPEVNSKSGSISQFAGLAALAGVDLGGSSSGADAVRPDLYPDVLKSTPFFMALFKENLTDKKNTSWVFEDYYNKEVIDGKVAENDLHLNFPKSEKYIAFNRQTEKNIKDLKERIICTYDKKNGIITISVKMPDPVMAANVTSFTMNYLTNYIVNYRTEKINRDLSFLAERLDKAKSKYFNNQSKKANYSDQMPLNALRLQSADLQRERIESEYKISSTFYNTLLQKYEEAKLQMEQEKPVIKILEPPVVPNLKFEPKKSTIVLYSGIIGFFISFVIAIIIHNNYKSIFN